MTKEEIISGLQFTVDMFLLDPSTGETYTEPRNDMDKTTIDACKGAIELLEQEPCEDAISRQIISDYVGIHIQEINTGYGDLNRHTNEILRMIVDYIGSMPPVTPQPKTGHWDKGYTFPDGEYWKCTKCKELIKVKYPMNYCSNCGSKNNDDLARKGAKND